MEELIAPIDFLAAKFKDIQRSKHDEDAAHWIMGQLHKQAIGNIDLKELREHINKRLQ